MPPPLLIDLDRIDSNALQLSQDEIYKILPHRHEFKVLSGVCHYDKEALEIVAFCDIREDDWWVRGHIPGRPLLPGVIMLEMAAHVATLLANLSRDFDSFIGFGGVDACKFRDSVTPPARLYILAANGDIRARRVKCSTQGVANNKLIFEAQITGITLR